MDPAYVYLPPQYFQKQYERQRFPVVVAISGYPGGHYLLAQHLRVTQTAGDLIAKGKMQPTVIVMLAAHHRAAARHPVRGRAGRPASGNVLRERSSHRAQGALPGRARPGRLGRARLLVRRQLRPAS
ncbi:hypothetical protein SRIMM317S_01361 [Streptomyces rimosus subsp. rimosus]